MPQKIEPVFDSDNPEWTEQDFARAKTGEDIPPISVLLFLKHAVGQRGRPSNWSACV